MEDLDGDVAVVPEVVGEVDGRHPASPELALDAVAVSQSSTEVTRHQKTRDSTQKTAHGSKGRRARTAHAPNGARPRRRKTRRSQDPDGRSAGQNGAGQKGAGPERQRRRV